jgi:hypothetical protein
MYNYIIRIVNFANQAVCFLCLAINNLSAHDFQARRIYVLTRSALYQYLSCCLVPVVAACIY